MELTFEELESHIDEISTGMKIVDVENREGDRVFLILKQPKSSDRIKATCIYKQTFQKATKEGLPTRDEMNTLLIERNIITDADNDTLKKLRSQLDAQRAVLIKTTKVKAKKERILGIIRNIENQIREIILKRERNFSLTAEAKSSEEKLAYLCCKYVYTEQDELLWPTQEDYNSFTDHMLRSNVLLQYSEFFSGISVDIIRFIARSNLWRIRYLSATKCGCDLFGIPVVDYSVDMVSLLYWSHFYQGVYEMMPDDQPTDEIIEDDDALDTYMENYYREMKNERLLQKDKKASKRGRIDASDSEQVIITPSHELHEDIEFDKPREAQRIKDKSLLRDKGTKIKKVSPAN